MKYFIKLAILFFISSAALAVNYGFMENTAMSYFTKSDWAIFNKTQSQVLNSGKNGVKTVWKNPASGAYGYMIPSAAPSVNGMVCRNLAFYNNANSIPGEATYRFCKTNNGWKIY